jgi:pyruvate kinase
MAGLLRAGMNVARLNFSHGAFEWHEKIIDRLRTVSQQEGRRLAIMADLPGPKIRIGLLENEAIHLKQGDDFTLTTEEIVGDEKRAYVSLPTLPDSVKVGDQLFLNDGIIHLEVCEIMKTDVRCTVLVGGDLLSKKGVNLPGIDLGISTFTDRDHECLRFALSKGVDAVSQSFVACASDIHLLRNTAAQMGKNPFIIAKIERTQALDHVDSIIDAADGIMIARGDLGVEIPLERIAIVQKQLTHRANRAGKPVITATHMLESMVDRRRPTRAEVTDVANAILDGTDAVMLSEESALGSYPVESVEMLCSIAAGTEPYRPSETAWEANANYEKADDDNLTDYMSRNINHIVDSLEPAAVIVPTASGHTARMVSRFKLPLWIVAFSRDEKVCRDLQFSYGVHGCCEEERSGDWKSFIHDWMRKNGLPADGMAVLVRGPSREHPDANHSVEIILPNA